MPKLQSRLLSLIRGLSHAFPNPEILPPDDHVRLHQVHGDLIVDLTNEPADQMRLIEADGLFTRRSRPIAIQTGDCLPVLLASSDGSAVAAVHAGWRGVHKGILARAVERFTREGVAPRDLTVAIGPAIGPCCFEISRDVIDRFEQDWGHLWRERIEKPWQSHRPASAAHGRSQAPVSSNDLWLDLGLIARLQLNAAGVPLEKIDGVGFCTYCGPGEFASYRRGTHEGRAAGRQWSWIQRHGA